MKFRIFFGDEMFSTLAWGYVDETGYHPEGWVDYSCWTNSQYSEVQETLNHKGYNNVKVLMKGPTLP